MKGGLLQPSHPPNTLRCCESSVKKYTVWGMRPILTLSASAYKSSARGWGDPWAWGVGGREVWERTHPTGQKADLYVPSLSTCSLVPTDFTYKLKDFIKNFKTHTLNSKGEAVCDEYPLVGKLQSAKVCRSAVGWVKWITETKWLTFNGSLE